MTEVTTKPKRIQRLQIGLTLGVHLILFFFLVSAESWIGFRHYKRWDVSREQKYALSDKTKRFLNTIKGKVRITVFFSPNTPISGDVSSLLTEYQYAAKGKIDIENIDPERNLSRAKEMFDKYKVVSEESLIVVDYEGRNKTVKASEMAEIDQSGISLGEGPRVTAFKGEQAITSAMMDLLRTGIQEVAITRDVQAHFLGTSTITRRLADVRTLFFGGTSSLSFEPDRVRAANIRLEPLIQAEKGYFAEGDYNTEDQVK